MALEAEGFGYVGPRRVSGYSFSAFGFLGFNVVRVFAQ